MQKIPAYIDQTRGQSRSPSFGAREAIEAASAGSTSGHRLHPVDDRSGKSSETTAVRKSPRSPPVQGARQGAQPSPSSRCRSCRPWKAARTSSRRYSGTCVNRGSGIEQDAGRGCCIVFPLRNIMSRTAQARGRSADEVAATSRGHPEYLAWEEKMTEGLKGTAVLRHHRQAALWPDQAPYKLGFQGAIHKV